jgi:hypothetical protein
MSKSSSKLKVETLKLWLEDLKKKTRFKTNKSYENTPSPYRTK